MKVAHKANKTELQDKYPNEGLTTSLEEKEIQENNYFLGKNEDEVKQKYLQWIVLMGFIHNVLELENTANISDMAKRSYELHMYNNKLMQNEQ